MRWFELMEGRSEDLFHRYGGKVMKFAQLPDSAKKALDHVSNFDGWDIDTDGSLFGYVILPIEEVKHACMTAPDNEFADEHDDWDSYHEWYWSGEQDAHYANHLTDLWPVILDDHEGILDGWHRLHWYHRNGVEQVPAILFVNAGELTEAKKHKKRKRRRKYSPIGIGYGYYYGWPGSGNDSGQGPADGGGDGGGGE